jgi:hypothetical protein
MYQRKNGVIYCGFSGIGKTYATKYRLLVDIERETFHINNGFEHIVDTSVRLTKAGHNVGLGTKPKLRQYLTDNNIPYVLVLPHETDGENYIKRYKKRNNDIEHIERKIKELKELHVAIKENTLLDKNVVILEPNQYFYDYLMGVENA